MRNFIQPGNSLAIAVPYATGVSAGQGVLVGALFGVAAVDGVQNAMIEAADRGRVRPYQGTGACHRRRGAGVLGQYQSAHYRDRRW